MKSSAGSLRGPVPRHNCLVNACAYCGRPAPHFDDPAILEWEGGEALYQSSDLEPPPESSLVCPDCRSEEREEGEGG